MHCRSSSVLKSFLKPGFPTTITIAVSLSGSEVDGEVNVTVWGGNVGAFCNGTQASSPK